MIDMLTEQVALQTITLKEAGGSLRAYSLIWNNRVTTAIFSVYEGRLLEVYNGQTFDTAEEQEEDIVNLENFLKRHFTNLER